MATRDELLALAQRAEAGGDAGLSDNVWRALGWRKVSVGLFPWHHPTDQTKDRANAPNLLASIDAQAELPGRIVHVDRDSHHVWLAQASQIGGPQGIGATEPLARLAAKLRAMAAMKESGDGA